MFLLITRKTEKRLEQFKTTPDFYINYTANRMEKPKINGVPYSFEFKGLTQDELLVKIKLAKGQEGNEIDTSNNTTSRIHKLINRLLKQ